MGHAGTTSGRFQALLWILGTVALASPPGGPSEVERGALPAEAEAVEGVPAEADGDGLGDLRARVRSRETGFFAAKSRRSAVRRLAALDRVPAWELVLGALADPVPMVADEAEVQLAALRHPPLVAELLGRAGLRSREDGVPVRAAQVLGRLAGPVDGEELAAALRARDPAVRRMLLWSIERLAERGALTGDLRGGVLPALERACARDRDAGVRAAAFAALGAVAGVPGTTEETRDGLARLVEEGREDDDARVRCAALQALAPVFGERACARLVAAAGDPSVPVRTQAALSLAALGSADGARGLAARVGVETELCLRWRVVALLRGLSGRTYGADAVAWARWAERLADDAVLPPEEAAPDPAASERREARNASSRSQGFSFGKLRLASERVLFLLDFSGSIDERFDGERTRKDYLLAELDRTLHTLDERTRFNLVPYSDEPEPWQPGLVPATRRRVERALDFFGSHRKTGSGDFWEAALLALDDPEVDTVVVFTDGAPTGGERWHLALMVDLLLERNRFRHVTFDSILVGAPTGLQNEWRRLAEATQGESVLLEPASADIDAPGGERGGG